MLVTKVNNMLLINIIQFKRSFFLGEVSIRLLHSSGSWTPITTLISVVEEVTKIIDTPDIDLVQNVGQYDLFYAYLCIYFYLFL